MPNTELYKLIYSLNVPGQSFDQVQGQTVTPKFCPFLPDQTAAFSLVSLGDKPTEEQGLSTVNTKLAQVSLGHCRSFELQFGSTPAVFWEDEYGNFFSKLATKGNQLVSPQAVLSQQEPSGFAVYGLQDTMALARILKASQLLRQQQIDTECFVKVIEPQALPFGNQVLPLPDFKDQLVQQIWQKDGRKEVDIGSPISRIDLPRYVQHLNNSTFVITTRGMQVTERIHDLQQVEDQDQFLEMMKKVFNYVNLAESTKNRRNGNDQFWRFNVANPLDLSRYFFDYLPQRIASNYAKLHNLGLLHVYSHLGNISAVGSIYDLDSVTGETLDCGDQKTSIDAQNGEFEKVFSNSKAAMIELTRHFNPTALIEGQSRKYEEIFKTTYFNERNVLAILPMAQEYYEDFAKVHGEHLFDEYMSRMIKELGWDFQTSLDVSDLIEDFLSQSDNLHLTERISTHFKTSSADDMKDLLAQVTEVFEIPLDRFHVYLQDKLDEELIIARGKSTIDPFSQLSGIDLTAYTVSKMFERREFEKLVAQISPETNQKITERGDQTSSQVLEYYKTSYKQVFMDLVVNNDPDFDLVQKLYRFNEIFDYFDDEDDPETMAFMNLYLDRITERTGFNHVHPETAVQLTQVYLVDVELKANMLLRKVMSNQEDYHSNEDKIKYILAEAFLGLHGVEGFTEFLKYRIEQTMHNYCRVQKAEIDEKWRDGHADLLFQLFAYREQIRIEKDLTEIQREELEEQGQVLEKRLRAELIQKLNG